MKNQKLRWACVWGVFLTAFIWVYPNFQNSENQNQWWPTKAKIVYGLDIQGGLHLVMGVDVDNVLQEKIIRLSQTFSNELKEQEIQVKSVMINPKNPKQIVVELDSASKLSQLEKYIQDFYPIDLQVIEATSQKMVLQYYATRSEEYKKQVVEQAIEVIRNRIDEFGVSEPNISAQGSDRVIVQLPGIKDSARAKELINRTARLDFRKVSSKVTSEQLASWVLEAEKSGEYKLGLKDLSYSKYILRVNKDLQKKIPQNTRVVFERVDGASSLEAGKRAYLIEMESSLNGALLEDASVRSDEFGKPEVNFKFNVEGRRRFAELTEKASGGSLAIVLDDVVKSAPSVSEKIDSSSARITLGSSGNYQKTYDEARFIATSLRAGALPAALEQLEERVVGPTLGTDSIEKGKLAGLIGSLLVALFMLFYYRFLGLVANIALSFNVLLILACLSALGATLTLPGVAGIILTVGMAVDANVIIFERIKEELLKGSGLLLAIQNGFKYALSAILDANITTAAICIVLMYFGTGPVRGFAVTLIFGIITSMFTSIFVSQTIITWSVMRLKVKKITPY